MLFPVYRKSGDREQQNLTTDITDYIDFSVISRARIFQLPSSKIIKFA